MIKINKKIILASLVIIPSIAFAADTGASGIASLISNVLASGATVIKGGLLIAALYGAYNLFIADDKSVLNWFLLVLGAAGIGAYTAITGQIVLFLSTGAS